MINLGPSRKWEDVLQSVVSILTCGYSLLESLFDTLQGHVNLNVAYDSSECEDECLSICKEGTLKQVLGAIENWAQRNGDPSVCWLYGPAGAGTSTIAHTIAQRYDERKELAFSYFFPGGIVIATT